MNDAPTPKGSEQPNRGPDSERLPHRVQRRRSRGWRMPPNAVAIGRGCEWGNPYKISPVTHLAGETRGKKEWWVENTNINGVYMFQSKPEAQAAAVKLFAHWVEHMAPRNYKDRARLALKGKDLACWCAPDVPCHADVLLVLANAEASKSAPSLSPTPARGASSPESSLPESNNQSETP